MNDTQFKGLIIGGFVLFIAAAFLTYRLSKWYAAKKKVPIQKVGTKEQILEFRAQIASPYDFVEEAKRGISVKAIKNKWNVKFNMQDLIKVEMQLRSGNWISFLVRALEKQFGFRKGTYIIDEDSMEFDETSKMWFLRYHEDFPMPIMSRINVDTISKVMKFTDKKIQEMEYIMNPKTLIAFVKTTLAQMILKGAELDEKLRRMMLLLWVNLIIGLIHFLIYLQKAGVFSKGK